MATLEELRSRLDGARDLKSVVTTMQAMAAVNLRQFRRVAESMAAYHRTIELGLQIVLREADRELRVGRTGGDAALTAVVLGSDQGMVGPFNERLAGHVDSRLRKPAPAPREQPLLVMGDKLRAALLARGHEAGRLVAVPASPAGIAAAVEEMVVVIDTWRGERSADEVWIFHNASADGASYEPTAQRLLPPDPQWLDGLRSEEWKQRGLPGVLGDPRAVFSALMQSHLFARLFLAVAESAAAENAARLGSMQSAERNIEERVDELSEAVRRRRQQEITEELLDISSGFEALASNRRGAG
ncbi:MAG TPA: F0F1 ATP synthase subunit gamma [Chondromyces sp.]|nr:F0F1 ATP synthase subunit gamma [Chondromyces sp.]